MILFLKIFPVMTGIICIIAGYVPEHNRKIKIPVFTEGEIVGSVTQKMFRKHSETLFHAPVVRYQTEQGELTSASVEFVPEWQYQYQKGDKITICYEKSNPQIFGIQNGSRFQFRKKISMTIGISILIAYAVLWVQYH